MIDWTFLLLIPSVLAVVWFLPHTSNRRKYLFDASSQDGAFNAVSIQLCEQPCGAAAKIEGKRILASDASALPLPGCDKSDCGCRYELHEDRRSGIDRRHLQVSSQYHDKRSGLDRRKNLVAYQ